MQHNDLPDTTYTRRWSNGRGDVRFFTRPDGSRLRYYTAGTGPPLVLMHTVRTQLDYFQRVIPRLWDHYTIYALDLPGMGWSDIVPGARYEEPDLRATLAGESLGAALALSASIDLKGRAPLSIKATLTSAHQYVDPMEADALSKLGAQYAALYRTEDFIEGRRAEAEGRLPKYQGK